MNNKANKTKKDEGYFPFAKVEKKWQKKWDETEIYNTDDRSKKEKVYCLVMFPYPSGAGLHMGHMENFGAMDIYARHMRMKGYEVLHPMGWDSFGLPTENYAIKNNISPKKHMADCSTAFRNQLKALGCSYDWTREFGTHEPEYYKWTQWLFTFLFEKGLAYQKKAPVNWCNKCQTVLANEQVIDGKCERCDSEVVQKDIKQWFFAITEYADRLIEDLDQLDWPESTKEGQRNWIGRSAGATINFSLKDCVAEKILLSTTNPSKKKRIEKLLKVAGFETRVGTPEEFGVEAIEIAEDESTLIANARKKARAYSEKVDVPVLAVDTGFFIDGEEIDFIQVKRNALEGKDESSMSQKEIAESIVEYYQSIARRNGGEVDAYWEDSWVLIMPNGQEIATVSKRDVVLTDRVVGNLDEFFPLRSMYKSKATGKFISKQSKDEELVELEPVTQALRSLFGSEVEVFTTRPDTIFGATYLVLSPENPLVGQLTTKEQKKEVEKYQKEASKKTELERVATKKSKKGVFTGAYATNPANKKKIPIWIADYVMMSYGTGAIMGVPAHDERDFQFAKEHDLEIVEVIEKPPGEKREKNEKGDVYTGVGKMVNSGKYDGMDSGEFKEQIVKDLVEKHGDGSAKKETKYRMRDWLISRQRYWGAPIPIIHCEKCGPVVVPKTDLPVMLPDDVKDYRPKGKPPLGNSKSFTSPIKCPKCGNENAKRELDTMDTFVCSSWYFFRFCDPRNKTEFCSDEMIKKWMPVDFYMGGAEHTVGHLCYSRFVTKAMFDAGIVKFKEPFKKLRHQGMVLAEDGRKMSKRWGNVVNPDEVVADAGADAARMYTMFMGPIEASKPWSTKDLQGVKRFVNRLWRAREMVTDAKPDNAEITRIHRLVKRTGEHIDRLRFNVSVSDFMIFVNEIYAKKSISKDVWTMFVRVLAPFAPFIAEELWSDIGETYSIHQQPWPKYDEKFLVQSEVTIAVQVNGKVRGEIIVSPRASETEAVDAALQVENVQKHVVSRQNIKKWIYVKGKILNLIV